MIENNLDADLDLPPDASHYAYRIGGHIHVKDKLKLGTLKHKDGYILKPFLDDDVRSAQELAFYEKIFKKSENDPILLELRNFIPSYHGTLDSTINGTNVKIGPIVWEPGATEEKIKKEKKKYPVVEKFGFRILGMKVYDHSNQTYTSRDKTFGVSLNTYEKLHSGIELFFNKQFGQINILIIAGYLHRLLHLKSWFSEQKKLVFISTSLLLVYESNLAFWTSWLNCCQIHIANKNTCRISVENLSDDCIVLHNKHCIPYFPLKYSQLNANNDKMCGDCHLSKYVCTELQKSENLYRVTEIDFAHVLPTTEQDSSYLFGLNKLILHFQVLLNSYLGNCM